MRRAILALLLLVSPAWAQSVKLPPEVKGDPGAFVQIAAETDCATLQWVVIDPGLNLFPTTLLKDTRTAVVTASVKGRYRLLAYGAKGDKASEPAVVTVVIGEAPPIPPGPTPPGPTPPTPGPVANMRVLIIEETAERSTLPVGKLDILFNKSVRDFLNTHCADWPEGKIKDWGIFDKDADLSGYSKHLNDLMKRFKDRAGKTPWIIVSGDGGVVFEGPLPENAAQTVNLLATFVPAKKKAG